MSVLEVAPLLGEHLFLLIALCFHENPQWLSPEGPGHGPSPHAMTQSIAPAPLIQGLSLLGVQPHQSSGAAGQPSSQHVALGAEPVCAGVKAQLQHPQPRAQIPALYHVCGLTLGWPPALVVEGNLVQQGTEPVFPAPA